MSYTVYGAVRSRALRVLWTLEELGVSYDHIHVSPGTDEAKALNPSGKVPFLVEDGQTITDSVAIMTYLADKHSGLTAKPGTLDRAHQDAFVQQVNDELDAVLWTAARHSFVLPEAQRHADVKDSLRWEFARNQDAIAARMHPDGPFVAGEQISVADILLSHCVGWAQAAKFEVTHPRLISHNTMMRERPAFKAALANAG